MTDDKLKMTEKNNRGLKTSATNYNIYPLLVGEGMGEVFV